MCSRRVKVTIEFKSPQTIKVMNVSFVRLFLLKKKTTKTKQKSNKTATEKYK